MKTSILSVLILTAFFCSFASSLIIDGWRYSGNPAAVNLLFPIASSTYFNNTAYVASKLVNQSVIGGRLDSQLLFRQRDLNIALTSKTDTSTGGSLAMTFASSGNTFQLGLSSAPNAGGVYTVVYDAVEGDQTTGALLPPACTSTFNNPVLLDSPNCADATSGITELAPTQAVDLTRGGTNFAFVLPVISVTPAGSVVPIIIRIWSTNSSSVLRTDSSAVTGGQLTLEFSRFVGTASFRQVEALAVQTQLAPGQNITFGAFQAVGVSLVKNMILFDSNQDGIANPGETVQMSITVSKPFLPASLGSWTFSWSDVLSDLVSLQPTTIQYNAANSDGSIGVPSASANSVAFQGTSPAGSGDNIYTVTFLTTVNPVADNAVRFLSNNVTLNFSISSDSNTYTIVASAPQVRVAGAPELTIESNCPAALGAGDQATILYTITNNGTIDANNVVITQSFNPTSGVISQYDNNWVCTPDSTNTSRVSCYYQLSQSIGYPGNFNGEPNTASVNFTFTVTDSLDCSLTSLNLTSSVESSATTGAVYTFPPTSCSIDLLPTVNLSIRGEVVGNTQAVRAGDIIYYNVFYNNTGNSAADNLLIYDNFPQGTTPVIPPSFDWICDNNSLVCVYQDTNGPLAPGTSRSVLIGLRVGEGFTGAFVCNVWSITSTNTASQFCSSSANSNQVCSPLIAATPTPTPGGPTPSPAPPCPSYSPPPTPSPSCIYCLAGSTINISLKSMLPSGSCSSGGCTR